MTRLLRAIGSFFFTGEDNEPENEQQQQEQAARHARQQHTVLVIDDDPAFLDGVRSLLRNAGFNVLHSTSGPKGLNMLRYAPRDIHLVLLDYNMPGFNGAETLAYVRKLGAKVHVIAMTGFAPERLPESFRNGVDHFIHKPFTGEELVSTVDQMIAGSGNGGDHDGAVSSVATGEIRVAAA
jgi:CheY-like chemotaxis protein